MRNILLAASFVLAGFVAAIGQGKQFTLEESVLLEGRLRPERIAQLDWIPGTQKFAYVKEVDGDWMLMAGAANSSQREVLASLESFNQSLNAADFGPMTSFPAFKLLNDHEFRFFSDRVLCIYDWKTKKIRTTSNYEENGENIDLSNANGIAYTIQQNLFLATPEKPKVAVTNEANQDIRNGESAHRDEFGITKGTFFSDQGDKLAFYRVDETMVTNFNLYNLHKHPATTEIIKYPFAGEKSHHATIGVYDIKTGKTTFLKTEGDPEHYLTNITWSPDGNSIYVAELNRDQNHLQLIRYNASTGDKEKVLFEEMDEKWVEPKHGLYFLPGKPDEFLWQSQRDGFNHLYHYKTDGTLLGQITKSSEWLVTDILGLDAGQKHLIIETTGNFGTDRIIRSVDLKKLSVQDICAESGFHKAMLSSDGQYLIDQYSSVNTPMRVLVREVKSGKIVQELLNAEDPLKEYAISRAELGTIKAADGKTDLSYRLIKPTNFDPSKKYPVLVYVYNGPGVQLIANSWMAAAPLWTQYMAQQGYVIFTLDGRGSANRGRDFEQVIFRDLGTNEIDDQMKGVEFLKSLPYVDAARMVVHGWSYGGFMTSNLMLRKPGTFNAGVAGGPVIDWRLYEVMYTERYMDTPEANKAGYDKTYVSQYIKNLKGKLMLIHGTNDNVVVWQHSLDMLEKSVSGGIQIDFFAYPNHPHNVRGKDRAHLMRKVLDYLMENNN